MRTMDDGIKVEEDAPKSDNGDGIKIKKGAWSKEEDEKLRKAVEEYGIKNWVKIQKLSGLSRPAKNCRLRWLNYLRPNLKKHPFTEEEEKLIFDLHSQYGNSWVRIASKLPGRSDNEIKNFWHKRVKKCKGGNLKPTKQSHTNVPNIIDNHSSLEANTNPPPNIENNASDAPSIHSPQPQFLSSPSSILTSSHQTTPLVPYTPTSHTQNLFFSSSSPNQTIPDNLQASSLCQGSGGASSSLFTSLTKPPPILSPPDGLFSGAHSTLPEKWSSAMESPRSPLKLKLSPGVPTQYSTQTTDSALGSLTGFQLNSPNTAPLSPLKLRLSIPIPSKSCFGSNLSIPATKFQTNSLGIPLFPQPMTVGTDHMVPLGDEQRHSIQFSPAETSGVNSYVHEVEFESSLEIMEELRKAQARVRFLKKKLKHRNKHVLDDENLEITKSLRLEVPPGETSSESAINDCALMNSRKKYMLERTARREGDILQVKKSRKEVIENLEIDSEKATNDQNFKLKISSGKCLQRDEDSHGEITKNLKTFQEQTNENFPVPDAWGNKLCTLQCLASTSLNECSSIGGLLSESSGLWQDSFLKGDFFDHTRLIGDKFSSQRHEPLIDVFGIAHREQPGNEGGLLSYLQTNDFSFPEHGLMDGNMSASESQLFMHQNPISDSLLESQLCEQNFTQHQSHATGLLDSRYQSSKQAMVQGPLQGVQLESRYLVGCGQECPSVEQYCLQMWKQEEPCAEQSLIDGLLADNLWQSQMVLQDQTFPINRFNSINNYPVEPKNWNNESTSCYIGQGQEHDNMNMSEELSSLLDFFPTRLDDASDEFEFDMGLGLQIS